jgi:hypothetical protein
MCLLALRVADVVVKKDPLAWVGSGSVKSGVSDRLQPLAPRMRVVMVIMVVIISKPPRARASAPKARVAVARAERLGIEIFLDGIPKLPRRWRRVNS